MYCPQCLNDTLQIQEKGTVFILINGKTNNTGRIRYNLEKDKEEEILRNIKEKIVEVLKWYSTFKNIPPVFQLELASSDYKCMRKCPISATSKFTIVDVLIKKKDLLEIIEELNSTYRATLALKKF